jgi:LAS superfamily LD-carboxypeptidase LdcB
MSTRTPQRRWIAAIVAAVVLASTVAVGAQSEDDLRSERERVRQERAATAAQLDVAHVEIEDLLAALDDLDANVRAEEAQLEDAQRQVAVAEEQVSEARTSEEIAEAEVAELRDAMARMAVDAYVNPPDQDNLSVVLTGDLGSAPERQALLEMSASNRADVLEQYRAAVEDLAIQTQTAEQAQQRALDAQAEVESRLQSVQEAREAQTVLAAQAQQRLYELLDAERQLEDQEATIDAELAEIERQRQIELERQRQAELERQRQELAALQAAIARQSQSRGPVNVPGQGSIQLTTVGGITVNSQIADQLGAMQRAAAADGIILTGGGYRDSSQQIALRRANCGSSNYAIYEMPASQCRPPTAQPGRSLHEQGLAIDFIANGQSITSRSHPGFQWLAANASSYGFYNLPSEPWHWSTTGQ